MIQKVPLWIWLAVACAILVLANWAGTRSYAGKLWRMVADGIRSDQSRVVSALEENMRAYEEEITRLAGEMETLKADRARIRAENERLKGAISEKENEILRLRAERESIVVSTDPDALVIDLRRLGYGSAYKQSRSNRPEPGR